MKLMTAQLLKYLTYWHDKTDDDCIYLATNENGINAEEALLNMVERDFCVEINNNIIKGLKDEYGI